MKFVFFIILFTSNLLAIFEDNSYTYVNEAKNGNVKKAVKICTNSSFNTGYSIYNQQKKYFDKKVSRDELKEVCKIAIKSGDWEAETTYAKLIMGSSNIIEQELAFKLFLKNARKGEVFSYDDIATMYLYPKFRNLRKSEYWFLKAINEGALSNVKEINQCTLALVYILDKNSSLYNLQKAFNLVSSALNNSNDKYTQRTCESILSDIKSIDSNIQNRPKNNSKPEFSEFGG